MFSDTPPSPFRLIDTHAHIQMEDFDADRSLLLARQESGLFPEIPGKNVELPAGTCSIEAMIVPGVDLRSSEQAVELARSYPAIHPAVGIHPNHVLLMAGDDWQALERLAAVPGVVALGETGLDQYWDTVPLPDQKDLFRRHLQLGRRCGLPVIIHCREAESELLPLLREEVEAARREGEVLTGVIHSFSGDLALARECVALGFYLGFTAPITYTSHKFDAVREAAAAVPSDRVLLETDSPFLIPHPFRGRLERNEPLMAFYTARCLAALRGIGMGDLLRQTSLNANRLFHLTPDVPAG